MGVSYYGYAVIGVEVDVERLYKREYERACDCDIEINADAPPKYCSDCGEVFLEEVMNPIDGYDPDDNLFFGWNAVHNTDKKRVVIGLATEGAMGDYDDNVSHCQLPSLDLTKMKEDLKNALGPILWDEKKFRLYSVMYCSY